jgi:hypothetical protein
MAPADREDLETAILRKLINFRVQGLKICRTRVNALEGLTEHIYVVNKVDRLRSAKC